ncbi:MAG: polysaccharide biosynthesis tyrosine autokinase [Bacteroidota bacterium]
MASQPSFPPETFPTQPEADDLRSGYYGPSRRPPSDFANQLRDWIDVVIRGRWWILAATLVIAIPVAAYAILSPNVYESAARLTVEPTGSSQMAESITTGGPAFVPRSPISDELYILNHDKNLALSAADDLLDRAETAEAGEYPVLRTPNGDLLSREALANRIRGSISIAQDGEDVNAVRVTASSYVPAEAALIANAYADAYVDRTQNSSRASVAASRTYLQAQADSVAQELAAREEATREFMEQENAVRLDEESANLVQQLQASTLERDQARVEIGMLTASIAQLDRDIEGLERDTRGQLSSNASRERQLAEEEILNLRTQLAAQQRYPNPDQARIDAIQADIDRQQTIIDRTSNQVADEAIATGGTDPTAAFARLSALKTQRTEANVQLQGFRSRITQLNRNIAAAQADLERLPGQSVELARRIRDRETTERLAASLDQKLQEARVAESAELGYAEVISEAGVPGGHVAPDRPRMIILGLLLGLGLGVMLAIGRDQFDQRLRRPDDIRERGYPLLGVIPSVDALVEKDFAGQDTVEIDGWKLDTRLTTLLAPTAQASEAYRGLRTSVQFSRPDAMVRRIVVTSASPGEGKSTVASNLAIVMAQAGRKTLLIDGDLRRSRVHRLFGVSRSPGLTDYVSSQGGGAPARNLTVADNIDVLPAGSVVPNPSEHLGSRSLREFLDGLNEIYDVVIIDAPPIMAATDPILLATQADATIVVTRAGQTKDFELDYVMGELGSVGAHVIGVVLNRFDIQKEYGYRYQYAYRYGNNYSYGSAESQTA